MRKNRAKKREPIERVYKDGREAIVKDVRKKAISPRLSRPRHIEKPVEAYATGPAAAPATHTVVPEQRPRVSHISINEYELPSYDTTRLTLIAKDPFWIYAYWEIAQHDMERVMNEVGDGRDRPLHSKIVLRMYDVTYKDFNGSNANHWFDIDVGNANNWYINLWHDNVCYCADLGIRTSSGRFFAMARSNFVQTPRISSSDRFEEIWMDLRQEPFEEAGRGRSRPSPTPERARGMFSYPSVSKRKRIYLSEADLRRYYSELSPLLRELMFSRIAKKRIYRHPYSRPGRELEDMLYLRSLAAERFGTRIMLGASEFMFLGGSENLPQGASEFVQPGKKRKFFFEIGTELIVYGRTEHDADVRLGDKKVNLRPDGTFSMRFSLPDGKIPLPFRAASKDKVETRKIATTVERRTQRNNKDTNNI